MMRESLAGEVEGLSDERIAQVAIDFITFCFERRAAEWPSLYDEMCYVAGNRLYRGLGYEELREAALMLKLVAQGEADVRKGRTTPQETVFARLRKRVASQSG